MKSALGILAGTLPWLLHFALASMGLPSAAKVLRFFASLALNLFRFKKTFVKSIEVATLAFSLVDMIACLLFLSPLFKNYSTSLSQGFLALFAWFSVLSNRPFTVDYAKDDWPAPYWKDPLFTHTNVLISMVWALSFTSCALFPFAYPQAPAWLYQVVNSAFVLFALVFSSIFPAVYPVRVMAKRLREFYPGSWDFSAYKSKPGGFDAIVLGDGLAALTAATLLAKANKRVLVVRENPTGDHDQPSKEVWNTGAPDLLDIFLSHAGLSSASSEKLATKELFPGAEGSPEIRKFFATVARLRKELLPDPKRHHLTPYYPSRPKDLVHLPARFPLLFPWLERPFEELLLTQLANPKLAQRLLEQLDSHFPKIRKLPAGRAIVLLGVLSEGTRRFPSKGEGSLHARLMSRLLLNNRVTMLPNHGKSKLQQEQGKIRGVCLVGGAFWPSPIVIMPGKQFDAHPWIGASKGTQRGLVLIEESEIPDIAWLSGAAAAELILLPSRKLPNVTASHSYRIRYARSKGKRSLRISRVSKRPAD